MAHEYAYALVTPYTIRKSRTGAVLARLLGRASGELVATQMVAATREMAERYAATIRAVEDPSDEQYRQLIRDYIVENFSPDPDGRRHRALMLLFRGENAVQDIGQIVGALRIRNDTGETIRDAYGDLVLNPDGSVRYFEPAVLVGDTCETVRDDLQLWLDFMRTQPPVLENICYYEHPENVQQTLVLIKPDSWRQRSSRPGAIMDMFSRTGLRIIACKLCHLSVQQALEFYGPVQQALVERLSPGIGIRCKEILEHEFGLVLPDGVCASLTQQIGVPYAHNQFERIVQFMTGRRPSECPAAELEAPGQVACLALVYEGVDAVRKIRDVLGPTDPTKAPDGTVRREFGSDVMVNTAHASDSAANARREMGIVRMSQSIFIPEVEQLIKGETI